MRFEEGAAARTCVYRFLHRSSRQGFFQCKVHTMPRQLFLPTIPTDLQNMELQSVKVRALKKLRYKPLVIQRNQKWKRLIVGWRIQPIPIREKFSAVLASVFRDGSAMFKGFATSPSLFGSSANTSSRTRSHDNSSTSSAVSCGTSSGYSTKRISRQMSS